MRKYIVFLIGLLLLLAIIATQGVGPIGAQGEDPTPSPTPTIVPTDEPSGHLTCDRSSDFYDIGQCLIWLSGKGISTADQCFAHPNMSDGTCCGGFPEDHRCMAATSTATIPATEPPPDPSPSPSPSPSPLPTGTSTATATLTPTMTVTPSPSPTGTWEPTQTPTTAATAMPTDEPKDDGTASPTPTMEPVKDFTAPRSGGEEKLPIWARVLFAIPWILVAIKAIQVLKARWEREDRNK